VFIGTPVLHTSHLPPDSYLFSPRARPVISWLLMVATLAAVSGCANSKLPQLSDVEREVKAFPLLRSAPWHSAPASAPAPSVMAPFAIALGPDGNLWFTEFHAAQIGRITPLGEIATFELGGGLPLRLTAGPYKAIWFTDPGGNRVGRLGMDPLRSCAEAMATSGSPSMPLTESLVSHRLAP
jgi:streptogramin lyase